MSATDRRLGKALRLGPEVNDFNDTDQTTTEAARDAYFSSNPSNLAVYDGNSDLLIRLTYLDGDTLITKYQGRIGGVWVDYTPVVQGPPGEIASLANVQIGEIPYKTSDGTFAGSNMRVLEDGTILAPPGFSVESGSITFGEALTISEISGYLGISNRLNGNEYTVVDFHTPRNSPSLRPIIFKLNEPEFEFIAQSVDTTNIPNNPLSFDYTIQNTARSRALKFRTYAAMANVRIKITQVSNGVALKYIPSQQAWEEGFGGIDWALGNNIYDFGDTSLNLQAGSLINFEIRATSVALKGNASNIPYFSAMIQRGDFLELISEADYTASDVKSKLESLVSPDKLSKTAIEDSVLSVNTRTGDVVLTKTDVGLTNVDNTSDANKPVSTAQQIAINLSMSNHVAAVDPHPQYTTASEASAAAPVQSVNTLTGNVVLTTANITESGNLYYSDSRVQNYLTASGYLVKTAASIGSGSAVYKQNTLGSLEFRSIIGTGNASVTQNANDITINVPAFPVTSVNSQTGSVVLTTSNVTEGTNLYYTDARVGTYLATSGYAVKSVGSVGGGASVYQSNTAGAVALRSILGSGSISVTQNASDITISGPVATGGTYTPNITNVSGVTTSSVSPAQWMRVDGTVTVSGQITVDPTGAGGGASVSIGMTLPVASNFANVYECAGTAVSPGVVGQCGAISADTTNDRASFTFIASAGSNQIWYYQYTYKVI